MKNQFPVKPPQLGDNADYNLLAKDACNRFPEKAELYREDKAALQFLLKIIMTETRGSANPRLVTLALKRELERRAYFLKLSGLDF